MVKLKDVVRNVISGANKQLPDHSTTQSTASTALATEIYTKISCIGPRALGIGGDKQSDFSNQAAELVTPSCIWHRALRRLSGGSACQRWCLSPG